MPESCAIVEKTDMRLHFEVVSRLVQISPVVPLFETSFEAAQHPIERERHTADMIAYVDGGSRGNPGPAGIGVVIEHPTGRRVEISQSISSGDNNYAEYAALLVALEYAAASGSSRLEVFSDSEVVVRQITGSYNCQSPLLRDIHNACRDIISKFQDFAITHIRRENNGDADRLAKKAMQRASRQAQRQDGDHSGLLENAMSRVAERLASPSLIAIEQAG